MPRKKGAVNKSQAIRDILAENPKTPTKEIVSQMAGRGIKVSDNLVYLIKTKSRAGKRGARRQKASAASRNSGHSNPVELILDVRHVAEKAGGMRRLKELVDILSE